MIKKMMTKERMLKSNRAIIEQEGGKVDDYVIDLIKKVEEGEITSEEALRIILEKN